MATRFLSMIQISPNQLIIVIWILPKHTILVNLFSNVNLESAIRSHKPVLHGGLFSIANPNDDILDFSSNVNPLGPSPKVIKTIKKNLDKLKIYPDSESTDLKKHIQKYAKIHFSKIVVGNGATEIIYNFCKAFLSPTKKVLIPIPTFGEYEASAKLEGAKIIHFKTMNLKKDLDNLIYRLPKNGCTFICNPNNPTGILLCKKELKKIVIAAKKKNTLVFLDECFIELVPDHDESVIELIKHYDNLFILRSFTKSYGLAGIRIGYGLGSKKIISVLNRIKIPWNVSGLAQQAALAALSSPRYLPKSKKLIKTESYFLKKNISKIKIFEPYDSTANFILIKSKIKSTVIQKKLLQQKILIRDCTSFSGLDNYHFRIAVRTRKENLKLLKGLKKI